MVLMPQVAMGVGGHRASTSRRNQGLCVDDTGVDVDHSKILMRLFFGAMHFSLHDPGVRVCTNGTSE